MGSFSLVFKMIGLGIVLGIGAKICQQVGRDDIAQIAGVVAIITCLGLSIPLIVNALSSVMSVFSAF